MTERFEEMLNQLESHKLEVMLTPSRRSDRREWDMIRVVVDQPPNWYRRLCNRHASSRGVRRGKFDTRIRRRDVLTLLRKMASGQTVLSKYAGELRELALSPEAVRGERDHRAQRPTHSRMHAA